METVEKMGVKNEMIVNHNFCLQQFIYNHLEMSFYTQVELLRGYKVFRDNFCEKFSYSSNKSVILG